MHTARNILLISFAALIDLLQAGISAALFMIGAFPGTVGGSAAGCLIGAQIAGEIGCGFLGLVAGVAGSTVNGAAVATLPIAIGIGFAINFCLDITLGVVLIGFLMWLGMYHKGYGIGGFIVELIPGLDNIPGWTFMTIMCVVDKTAREKNLIASKGSMFTKLATTGITGVATSAVFAIHQGNQRRAREAGVFTQEEQDQRLGEKKQFVSAELRNIDGIRAANPNTSNLQRPESADNEPQPKNLRYAA